MPEFDDTELKEALAEEGLEESAEVEESPQEELQENEGAEEEHQEVDYSALDNLAIEDIDFTQYDDSSPELVYLAEKQGYKKGGVKSAGEFLRTGPLFNRIREEVKARKALEKKLNAIERSMLDQKVSSDAERIKVLENQKSEAIREGDEDMVSAIDEEINKFREPQPVQQQYSEEVKEFAQRNAGWYQSTAPEHADMRLYFNKVDNELTSLGLGLEDHVALVEQKMHKKFPDYFSSKKSLSMPKVSSSKVSQASPKKGSYGLSESDLSTDEKQIMRDAMFHEGMTKKEYLKMYAKFRDVE